MSNDINQGLASAGEECAARRVRTDTADSTWIRTPRATSTSSASLMQYTVFAVGGLKERHGAAHGDRRPSGLARTEESQRATSLGFLAGDESSSFLKAPRLPSL